MAKRSAVGTPGTFLGVGARVLPETARDIARYQFLQALRKVHPEPLRALLSDVFPLYRDWAEDFLRQEREFSEGEEEELEQLLLTTFKRWGLSDREAKRAAERRPPIDPLNDSTFRNIQHLEVAAPTVAIAVRDWAIRFKLINTTDLPDSRKPVERSASQSGTPAANQVIAPRQHWACEWAVETLWAWKFWPDGEELRNTDPPKWVSVKYHNELNSQLLPPIEPSAPVFTPQAETKVEFRNRIKLAIKPYIDEQIEAGLARAEAEGYQKSPRKRKLEHFEWFVLYHMAGQTYEEIASGTNRADSIDPQTIADAVRRTGELIGLEPRSGRRGPTRKPRTKVKRSKSD